MIGPLFTTMISGRLLGKVETLFGKILFEYAVSSRGVPLPLLGTLLLSKLFNSHIIWCPLYSSEEDEGKRQFLVLDHISMLSNKSVK